MNGIKEGETMSDFDKKDFGVSDDKNEHFHEKLGDGGFVSDGRCEDDYEKHESHAYDRRGDYSRYSRDSEDDYERADESGDYSRTEREDAFTSGSSGGSRYVGGSFYRRSRGADITGDGDDAHAERPAQNSASRPLGIASMVCGIVSILFCCMPFVGLVVAIVGLVLGIVSQKRGANGFALAGIITSSFGIAFGVIMVASFIAEIDDVIDDVIDSFGSDPFDPYDPNNGACASVIKAVVAKAAALFRLK